MNARFTCNPNLLRQGLTMGVVALSFLLLGAAHNPVKAAPAEGISLPPASIVTANATTCTGTPITFDLGDFDFEADNISEVPWVIAHNGTPLTATNLADFLELGALAIPRTNGLDRRL